MPAANCAFKKCGVKGREKFFLIAIFTVPKTGQEFSKWRRDNSDVLLKYREIDANLKERLKNGKVCICKRHCVSA